MQERELREARRIVEDVLRKHVKSASFDPVMVRPGVDGDGDEVLYITAVCDDEDNENLDADEAIDVRERLWQGLLDAGIQAFPVTSFDARSEWEADSDEPE